MSNSMGNRALDTPASLADAVGLGLRKTLDTRYPARAESFRVDGDVTPAPDGSESYTVRARSGDGTGVDINVDRDEKIRVTPIQSRTDGSDVNLPSQTYRWDVQPGDRQGVLQLQIRSEGTSAWVAAQSAGALGSGQGLSGVTNLVLDGASAVGSTSDAMHLARLLDRDAAPGIRAVRSGADTILPSSYQQDGLILYNGFNVVAQQIRGGHDVLYNKADLLDGARDPGHLERLLDEGGRQRLLVTPNGTDSQPLDRPDQLDRALHR